MTPPPVPPHHLDHGDIPRDPTDEHVLPLAPPRRTGPLQSAILADLALHPRTSSRAMANRLDEPQALVSSALGHLRIKGTVTRTGPQSASRWSLTPTSESTP